MALRESQPVPTNHTEYDGALLRAVTQGPFPATVDYISKHLEEKISNPWYIPWHIGIKTRETPCTIEDFSSDLRTRLEQAITRQLSANGPRGLSAKTLPDARRLMQHLSHMVVQLGVELHCDRLTPEEMCSGIRDLLKSVCHPTCGIFVMETPAHPFWNERSWSTGAEKGDESVVAHVSCKKPTIADRELARYLANPNINLSGPDGRITDLLREVRPELLSRESNAIIRYAGEMRRDIRQLLSHDAPFDDECRAEVINRLADEWMRMIPNARRDQLSEHANDAHLSAAAFLEKHFPPEVVSDAAEFQRRRPLLEERSIMQALELAGRSNEHEQAEFDSLWRVWDQAIVLHKYSLCDYPTLALAYLSNAALNHTKEKFLYHL